MPRPIGSPAQLEQRRLHALELLRADYSVSAVAKKVGCARSAVYAWRDAFQRDGEAALKAKPASGRPLRLKPPQRKQLARILLSGATKFGYPSEMCVSAGLKIPSFRRFWHPTTRRFPTPHPVLAA